jgi:hypothetical protein
MTADIFVALGVAAFAMVGNIVGARLGIREANKLTCYRVEELEKKVDKHNKVIDRTALLESKATQLDQKIDAVNTQLDQKIEAKCDLVDRRFQPIEHALSI